MSYDLFDFVFHKNNFVNKKKPDIGSRNYRFCLVYNSLEIKHYFTKDFNSQSPGRFETQMKQSKVNE